MYDPHPPVESATLDDEQVPFLKVLGPGLITGVSDDDPSGIATYSQAGAQFGLGLIWTMLFSYPLMASVQEIAAHIGRVTGRGLAANMKDHYSPLLLYPVVILLVIANVLNLGADIGAVGESLHLVLGGSAIVYCALFVLVSLLLQIFIPYTRYVFWLKWLCLSLFAYVATVFTVSVPWLQALRAVLVPHLNVDAAALKMFVAILGTTISPYLFFWQASEEAEEVTDDPQAHALNCSQVGAAAEFRRIKMDTYIGMGVSNIVAIFIMITTAVSLNAAGITQIDTAAQAAEALRPLAGPACFWLFSLGIIGTGLLAVPVLAGSTAYAVGEALGWPIGLERKPLEAKAFYTCLAAATLVGLALNLIHFDPIKALIWSAVINGVAAVPIIVVMLLMASNHQVMNRLVISWRLKALGWLTAGVMAIAAVGMFLTI